jgi:ABC-2 type transport system ATP-binding protein
MYSVPNLEQRIESVVAELGLEPFRHKKAGLLSSGEQTRVSVAKAMLNNPSLLLLDEPTASLDPSAARDIRAMIKDIVAKHHTGVLWTSHNMNEVEQVCDRVMFMSKGKILLEGNPRTLPKEHGKATLEDLFITVAREPLTLKEAA